MAVLPISIFGLSVEPSQEYKTVIEEDTHLTMVCLAAKIPSNPKRTSVVMTLHGNSFTLCSLTPGASENQAVDLYLQEGDEVSFHCVGNCPVDITGNVVALMPDGPDYDEEEDISDDEEIDYDNLTDDQIEELLKSRGIDPADLEDGESDEEIDSDEAEATPKITEVVDDESGSDQSENEQSDKEQSGSEQESEESEESEASEEEPEMKVDPKLLKELNKKDEKNEKKRPVEEQPKEVKADKRPKVDGKENSAEQSEKYEKPEKKTLPSGLVMEDFKVGTGPKAKKGKKVSVRYIGKLSNGKVFDSNTKGSPFQFKLGGNEVIKGWDVGVVGMAVGGTRKLTIPPALAYGSRGAPPDIPKNATLTFEIKLLQIK